MHLHRLRASHLRSLADVDFEPSPQLNLFVGANGAGKTSVLEAVFLLSRGRSFRTASADILIRHGSDSFYVYGEVDDDRGAQHRLGLERQNHRWTVQVDGAPKSSRSALLPYCPVVCFDPNSHALIAGSAEGRRRFADWGVFHVEPSFLTHWQRYQRALTQRNALLRQASPDRELAPWEHEMAIASQVIDSMRGRYLEQFSACLLPELHQLVPALGAVHCHYLRGWDGLSSLQRCLELSRPRDRARGHSTLGAHRADWSLAFEHAPAREHLSRGQEKLVVLACMLAQATLYAQSSGSWPIVCLDDLRSELDGERRAALIQRLLSSQAQVWITDTEPSQSFLQHPSSMFHVEHGVLRRMV